MSFAGIHPQKKKGSGRSGPLARAKRSKQQFSVNLDDKEFRGMGLDEISTPKGATKKKGRRRPQQPENYLSLAQSTQEPVGGRRSSSSNASVARRGSSSQHRRDNATALPNSGRENNGHSPQTFGTMGKAAKIMARDGANKAKKLGATMSEMTRGLRQRYNRESSEQRSSNNDEVVDLCDDDDEEEANDSYQEGDTTITEHSVGERRNSSSSRRQSAASSESVSFGRSSHYFDQQNGSTPSSDAALASATKDDDSTEDEEDFHIVKSLSKRQKKSPERSRSSWTQNTSDARRSSAGTTGSTPSSNATLADDDSTEDEDELEFVSSASKRRKSSPVVSRSEIVVATNDLYPGAGVESEEEAEKGQPSVCDVIAGISDEQYADTPSSGARKLASKKRSSSSEPRASKAKAQRTSPGSVASSSSSQTSSAWGSLQGYSSKKNQKKLSLTKVNAVPSRKRKPATPIVPGASFRRQSASSDSIDSDPIEEFNDTDSEVEEVRPRRRIHKLNEKARATHTNPYASEGGVQRNPYAVSTRPSRARKAKTKGTNKRKSMSDSMEYDDETHDEFEYDDTALAAIDRPSVRKYMGAVRIAIGTKIQSKKCSIRYTRDARKGRIVLSYDDKEGKRVIHEIDLEDSSITEIKYFLAKDDVVTIDFDESEEMSFLAMQVNPTPQNGLSMFPNAYKPSESQGSSSKRYIAIEVRSDNELQRFISAMQKDEVLGAYTVEGSKLKPDEVEQYGSSLLKEARKERMARESSIGSPRVRKTRKKNRGGKTKNEVMLVFPFDADEVNIDKAAEGLQEVAHEGLESTQLVLDTTATSKTSDDKESEEASSSDDTNAVVADDDNEEEDPDAEQKKPRAHFLTIRDEDFDRLQPGEFLNDTLIDFWFQWIWRKERYSDTNVHFFTSHFYTKLAKSGAKAVTSWTAKKNIDIFTKKFIFIPVNQSLHWSLAVVVNPGAIRNEIEECGLEVTDDSLMPCIFFFDSLKAHRKNVIAKNIREWLNSEWERLGKAEADYEKDPFDKTTMDVFNPRVPYQDNSWDCGVFVCRYGFALYLIRRGRDVTYRDMKDKFRDLISDSDEFDFDRRDIVRIRGELSTLVERLSALYKEWKNAKDEAEKKTEEEAKKKAEEEESKKPAARRLLLENGNANAPTEEFETASTSAGPVSSASPAATATATTSAKEATASSVEDQVESQAQVQDTDAAKESGESTLENSDVEMADAATSEDVEVTDNGNETVDGISETLSSLGLPQSNATEPEMAQNAKEVQTEDVGEDNLTLSVVKKEEDQFGAAECGVGVVKRSDEQCEVEIVEQPDAQCEDKEGDDIYI